MPHREIRPALGDPAARAERLHSSEVVKVSLALCCLGVLFLGVLPYAVLRWAEAAIQLVS